MLEAIGARLAASVLMQSPIGGFIRGAWALARKVPWQVWAALALALAVLIGVKIHNHKVSAFGTERFNSGFTAGYAKAKDDAAKAVHEVETKGNNMAHEVRSKNDAKTASIERDAGAVLMHGAGRAACSSVTSAAANGSPGSGQGNAAISPLPAGEGQQLIGLPVDAAVGFAKQNDQALADRDSWQEWYDRYAAIIADYQRKVAAFNAKQRPK